MTQEIKILPDYEYQLLQELLEAYIYVLREKPEAIKNYEYKIRLKNNSLICVKPYSILLLKQKVVEGERKRIMDIEVIK